ncbi:MAG: peptidoglycan-binding protein [Bdellovibrionaceae bacterium]|nr:peptidoglycan-binding protein [Pseudobdellovibrionaceae bacterium]
MQTFWNLIVTFFSWLGSVGAPKASDTKALEIKQIMLGDVGPLVIYLEECLATLGFLARKPTGKFDAVLESAVRELQRAKGLTIDGKVGLKQTWPKIEELLKKRVTPQVPSKPTTPTTPSKSTDITTIQPVPWMDFMKKYRGKKEQDNDFNAMMTPLWKKYFGFSLPSIRGSANAWCGLMVAAALGYAGIDVQRNGSLARHWSNWGAAINYKVNGAPHGAIAHINHVKCGNDSSNHVAFIAGNCTAEDLTRAGATVDLDGGNQADAVKISTYSVTEICSIRWPLLKFWAFPGKVTKTINCTSGSKGKESTR